MKVGFLVSSDDIENGFRFGVKLLFSRVIVRAFSKDLVSAKLARLFGSNRSFHFSTGSYRNISSEPASDSDIGKSRKTRQ